MTTEIKDWASKTNGAQPAVTLDLRTLIEVQEDIFLQESAGAKVVVGRQIWLEGAAETANGDSVAVRLTGDMQLLKDVGSAVIAARERLE